MEYHEQRRSICRWKTEITRSWTVLLRVESCLLVDRTIFIFCFFLRREWKVKYDLVDDDEADTLEYSYKNIFIYDPSKNGPGLTGEEMITLVHPLILGMALSVNVDRQELLPFITNAIKGILQAPTDPFWTGRVMDILFDGVPLDCRSDDFEVAAACGEFSTGEYKAIQPFNETFYKFSLFGGVSFDFFFNFIHSQSLWNDYFFC